MESDDASITPFLSFHPASSPLAAVAVACPRLRARCMCLAGVRFVAGVRAGHGCTYWVRVWCRGWDSRDTVGWVGSPWLHRVCMIRSLSWSGVAQGVRMYAGDVAWHIALAAHVHSPSFRVGPALTARSTLLVLLAFIDSRCQALRLSSHWAPVSRSPTPSSPTCGPSPPPGFGTCRPGRF